MPGQFAKTGAPVHAALDHDVTLLPGINADRVECVEVVGFLVFRNDDDLDFAGIEHRGRPHIHQHAGTHGPLVAESAIGQACDAAVDLQGRSGFADGGHGKLATKIDGDVRTHPRSHHLLHGTGVMNREGCDIFQTGIENTRQHGHGVHGATRSGVVVVVEQNDRPLLHRLCSGQGFSQRLDLINEGLTFAPCDIEQFIAQGLGPGHITVRRHGNGEAGIADVCVGETGEECCHQGFATDLHRTATFLQRVVGPVCRALLHDVGQHRAVAPCHRGRHFALERAHQDLAGALRGLVGVDVGIGLVAGQNGAVLDNAGIEVAMHVQRHGNGKLRCDSSDAAQQLALTVFQTLGHHGPVQVQHGGITTRLDGLHDGRNDGLEGLVLDWPGRPGVGGHRRDGLPALRVTDVQERRDAAVGAAIGLTDHLSTWQLGGAAREPRKGRGHGRKRVGFVFHHRCNDLHARFPFCIWHTLVCRCRKTKGPPPCGSGPLPVSEPVIRPWSSTQSPGWVPSVPDTAHP